MKKIKYIISLLCVLTLMSACNDDESTSNISTTEPVLNSLVSNEWILIQPEIDQNPFLFRLNWTKARFFDQSGEALYADNVQYDIEADLSDNNFSKPIVLVSTTKLFADIYTQQFNTAIAQMLGVESKTVQNINIRVKTSGGSGESVYSEALTLVVTPYIYVAPVPDPESSKHIYIIGDMNGWNPNNTDFIMYRNSNDVEDGVYTYTGYFANGNEGAYFKFCAEEFLGGYNNMYCAGEGGKLEFGDTGAFYAGPGYYTVTIDIINMTWTLTPYDASAAKNYTTMGPIGGFCGWDNEPLMTKSAYDPHQWHIAYLFESGTACKFRGNKDWANNWGGGEFDIPYGKGVFDGGGASINEPGLYDIYFNDLTAHYIIKIRN
ncbi:SusE domain-containing protein [Dysgonomonas sp. ZJ709]|uniref:SusE domain-containing protein n=1 Tax=Dysgonomonas sp. ZJ709 TaxID=2709797 RepID=UPI0013EC9BE3|nr:SusE domain-containing protein [Dysgonomonas sp. ZJ709]